MKLSHNAQNALNKVVEKFESGDLSVVTEVIRIKLPEDRPAARWTLGNQVLAYIQTGSLDCRGYKQWEEVGRHVKRGCRAAYILAPRLAMIEDEATGSEKKTLCGFFGVPVFAYHDTDGDALAELSYAPRELPPLMEAAERLGVQVTWQPLSSSRLGDCTTNGTRINLGTHDPAVFFHELAHAAHAKLNGRLNGGQDAHQETVAEFTAAVLMDLYGLGDCTGNAWHYIQAYNKDPLKAIFQALSTVGKVLELLEGRGEADSRTAD